MEESSVDNNSWGHVKGTFGCRRVFNLNLVPDWKTLKQLNCALVSHSPLI